MDGRDEGTERERTPWPLLTAVAGARLRSFLCWVLEATRTASGVEQSVPGNAACTSVRPHTGFGSRSPAQGQRCQGAEGQLEQRPWGTKA